MNVSLAGEERKKSKFFKKQKSKFYKSKENSMISKEDQGGFDNEDENDLEFLQSSKKPPAAAGMGSDH